MLGNKSTVTEHIYTGLSALGVVSYLAFGSPTLAAIATFDSFSEGFSGTTITDEGITFFDLDERLSPDQLPSTFFVEGTTAEQLGSFFSASNYLTTGNFLPGPDLNFGRFGSARITTGKVEQAASLELFSQQLFSPSNNIVTLEALLNGNLVASNRAALADFEVVGTGPFLHKTLAVSGVAFDELRLVASGPDDAGVVFIGIDNVHVVPEPTSAFGVLAFGVLGAGSLLKRQQRLCCKNKDK